MPAKRVELTPEERLARYWRRRSKLDRSDFASLVDVQATDVRGAPIDLYRDHKCTFADVRVCIGEAIFRGAPLTFQEFYIAVAMGFLITELPYEKFYRTRWHETNGHRSYSERSVCYRCVKERAEKKKATDSASMNTSGASTGRSQSERQN